jgi:hypothetical protein
MTDPEAQLRNALLDLGHVQAFDQFRTAADPAQRLRPQCRISTLTDNVSQVAQTAAFTGSSSNVRRSRTRAGRPQRRRPLQAGRPLSARSRCVEQSGAELEAGPGARIVAGPPLVARRRDHRVLKDLRCCYRNLARPACGGDRGARLPGQSPASPTRAADAPHSALRCHDCACLIVLSAQPSKERVGCPRST